MVDAYRRANADTLDSAPGLRGRVALKKIDVVTGFVAGGRDAQGMQGAAGNGAFYAAEVEMFLQYIA